ncbi:LysR substrate-binding domain-containing protein [Psychrobacter proteolyticus]|uniref:LysR substrate-binding domain-containing protein n=1 Tax=Psychrobacter proteolyticus TaxID=147825 RepID=A0ABV0D2P3_9GAMM
MTGCGNTFATEPLTLVQVAAHVQLVVSPSHANLRGSHDQWFAEKGLKRNIVMSVPSFSAVPDILHTTDMIAFFLRDYCRAVRSKSLRLKHCRLLLRSSQHGIHVLLTAAHIVG